MPPSPTLQDYLRHRLLLAESPPPYPTRPGVSPTFSQRAAPRRPDGQVAWFTYEHNEHLERLLGLGPGGVLQLYQTHLVAAAQRILGENGDVEPPTYEGSAADTRIRIAVLERGREGERERESRRQRAGRDGAIQRRGDREGERERARGGPSGSGSRGNGSRAFPSGRSNREGRPQRPRPQASTSLGERLMGYLGRRRPAAVPVLAVQQQTRMRRERDVPTPVPQTRRRERDLPPLPRTTRQISLSLGGTGPGPVVRQGRISPRTSPTTRSSLRPSSATRSSPSPRPSAAATRPIQRSSPTVPSGSRFPAAVPARKPLPVSARRGSGEGSISTRTRSASLRPTPTLADRAIERYPGLCGESESEAVTDESEAGTDD